MSGELERHRDILDRGHGRDEMERLEHDPHIAATEACERVFVEFCQVFACDNDGAGVGTFEPGHDHEQRRLARAGRPDEADRLAACDMQIDVLEDMHPGRAAAEREIDLRQ